VKNIERKIDNFNLKTPKNININIIPQDLENIDVNQSPMLREGLVGVRLWLRQGRRAPLSAPPHAWVDGCPDVCLCSW
jgi:hypothetical protein